MDKLSALRGKIDAVDDQIIELLNARLKIVKEIGLAKNSSGISIYKPQREMAILRRLEELCSNKEDALEPKAIEAIYQEIFAVCRNAEKPQSVAFLGPVGTHTHQAASARFGAMSKYMPLISIKDVFKEVQDLKADFGVVPIENNSEGAVGATYDCLIKFDEIKIFAEIESNIHHVFASNCEDFAQINRIYSHPQAWAQCQRFLHSHGLMSAEFVPSKSTADGAFKAASEENSAAICSKIAAKLYSLPVLVEQIEDNLDNKTRFIVLSKQQNEKMPGCKTSIVINTEHKTGSLSSILNLFASAGINLCKIESRPNKTKEFVYSFFIDFDGHIKDDNVQKVLKEIGQYSWLGSYLKA